MPKIIQYGNAKPVYCVCCYSTYQWEYGDTIEIETIYGNGDMIITAKRLECPNCGYSNDIEFIKKENPNG